MHLHLVCVLVWLMRHQPCRPPLACRASRRCKRFMQHTPCIMLADHVSPICAICTTYGLKESTAACFSRQALGECPRDRRYAYMSSQETHDFYLQLKCRHATAHVVCVIRTEMEAHDPHDVPRAQTLQWAKVLRVSRKDAIIAPCIMDRKNYWGDRIASD